MKKWILRISLGLLALLVIYTVFNQFDVRPMPLEFGDEGRLPAGVYDKDNGFYRLWTLAEPPGTDIESDAVILKYRRLSDPRFDNDEAIKAFDEKAYKAMSKEFDQQWQQALKEKGDWAKPPSDPAVDWSELALADKDDIRALQADFPYLLARYRRLIDSDVYQDFTLPRWDIPIPNLLAWLRLAKLYAVHNMLDALEGNWGQAAANLLDQLDSGKKINKGSRTLIANLVAKAVTRMSAEALASLMNQAECPKEVFRMVLARTPPLQYEEFGAPAMVFGYRFRPGFNWQRFRSDSDLNFVGALWYSLFTQPNRTRNYRDRLVAGIIKAERILPYQWQESPFEYRPVRRGWFWWLQNPGGKIILDRFARKDGQNLAVVIMKSYKLKTTYESLRISADLHLNYSPERPVQEILDGLATYQNLPDPCTGQPYIWNGQKQILYSIGTDLKDDGGQPQWNTIYGDFVLPVVLYVR
jgi:hypothetical protein